MVETKVQPSGAEDMKKQPLFRDLNADDEQPEISEMESLCMHCGEDGTTRLLLTKIPFFKEVIIMSFDCPHCFYKDNQIQPGSEIQEKGIRLQLKVKDKTMMNRQIVKQKTAMFRIEELQFESPPFASSGVLTTVEGLFETAICGLEQEQPVRKIMHPELSVKIDETIQILKEYKSGVKEFTLTMEDASGNSFIENPFAPKDDPALSIEYYTRSKADDESLGLFEENTIENTEQKKENTEQKEKKEKNTDHENTDIEEKENFRDEVLEFPSNCSNCHSPVTTKMKIISIPHFKEVIIMACDCDSCGYKTNEVKPGGAIEEKGRRITLKMTDTTDLARDVLTSETCEIRLPDLDIELCHSSMGGRFTTVEGLLVKLKEQLGTVSPFSFGDSKKKNRMQDIVSKIDQAISGDLFITIVLDDPVGNSYIQNVYAPDPDPELNIELYERTPEQDLELGIADMNTENYR